MIKAQRNNETINYCFGMRGDRVVIHNSDGIHLVMDIELFIENFLPSFLNSNRIEDADITFYIRLKNYKGAYGLKLSACKFHLALNVFKTIPLENYNFVTVDEAETLVQDEKTKTVKKYHYFDYDVFYSELIKILESGYCIAGIYDPDMTYEMLVNEENNLFHWC